MFVIILGEVTDRQDVSTHGLERLIKRPVWTVRVAVARPHLPYSPADSYLVMCRNSEKTGTVGLLKNPVQDLLTYLKARRITADPWGPKSNSPFLATSGEFFNSPPAPFDFPRELLVSEIIISLMLYFAIICASISVMKGRPIRSIKGHMKGLIDPNHGRKCICDVCGNSEYIGWGGLVKASRPRCSRCGAIYVILELPDKSGFSRNLVSRNLFRL